MGGDTALGSEAAVLAHGGETGSLTRAIDWSASVLGAPETWPHSLRTLVDMMLASRHGMMLA